jgi:precorrin-6B methylase 2
LTGKENEGEIWDIRSGGASVVVDLVSARNHDKRDLGITKNSELMSFLEETISSFGVCNLPVSRVLNLLDLDLPSCHITITFST